MLPDDLGFHVMLWKAAAAWIGDRNPQTSEIGECRIVIPDTRAYFRDIVAAEQGLDVYLQCIDGIDLLAVATGRDVYGREFVVPAHASGESVRLPVHSVGDALRIYLTDGRGTTFDVHDEPHFGAVPGESLFHPPTREQIERRSGLDAAIRSGEDLYTEYKAWVPPTRSEAKLYEALETVVAFANTEGGSLYIGIADHGELVDTAPELMRTYGRHYGSDMDRMRSQYVSDLRELIAKMIVPRVVPEFDWIHVPEAWVLEVRISAGSGAAHYIECKSACFGRRGSTDRLMSPPEILQLDARRRPRIF